MWVGLIVCIVFMVIKIYCNQPYQDVYAIYCFTLCGQCLYKGIRQKEKSLLLQGIIWGVVAVILFIVYLTKILP